MILSPQSQKGLHVNAFDFALVGQPPGIVGVGQVLGKAILSVSSDAIFSPRDKVVYGPGLTQDHGNLTCSQPNTTEMR
jgi:hypothetical protein